MAKPTKNRDLGDAAGTGCSTESGLEQALERASLSFDSDEELEAIRGSVRSLRAQRAAVEKLKEKARREEGTAEVLRRKLAEAENRVRELRAQGGRDVVRRLMDEVGRMADPLPHRTTPHVLLYKDVLLFTAVDPQMCVRQPRWMLHYCRRRCCWARASQGRNGVGGGATHEVAACFRRAMLAYSLLTAYRDLLKPVRIKLGDRAACPAQGHVDSLSDP